MSLAKVDSVIGKMNEASAVFKIKNMSYDQVFGE
jgi:hypothetical protein